MNSGAAAAEAAAAMSWQEVLDSKMTQTCLDWHMGHSEVAQRMRIVPAEEVEGGGTTVGMVVVVAWCWRKTVTDKAYVAVGVVRC